VQQTSGMMVFSRWSEGVFNCFKKWTKHLSRGYTSNIQTHSNETMH